MKKDVRSLLSILLLLLVGSFVWAAGEKESTGSGGDVPTIVIMPKLVGIPYFNAAEDGAKKAGEDLGVNIIYTGPTVADAAEQVRMLEDYISRGVDAICVAPNDPAAMTPVLRKAKAAGIIVLDWDTPADINEVDASIHMIDDVEYGQHLWDILAKGMGNKGDYAILTGGLSAANLNAWIDAGLEYAKTTYPGLNLVTDKIPTDEMQQVAYQKTLELIKAYPNLKGIMGMSTPAPIGAAQAVQEKGLSGKITITGTGMPTDSKPYLEDGSLGTVSLWNVWNLGYVTAYVANKLINGEKLVDGEDIPHNGKIRVWDDGKTVIMGPPVDFTAKNAGDFTF